LNDPGCFGNLMTFAITWYLPPLLYMH